MNRASDTARLKQIVEAFAGGLSVSELAVSFCLAEKTIEAVIRQAMKLADRKGMGGR